MKFALTAIALTCLSLTTISQQALNNFFYSKGVKLLAWLAHPTNTYTGGSYRVTDNYVYIDINYQDNYVTRVKIKREVSYFMKKSSLFTHIEVTHDNDWIAPFVGIELIKDVLMESAEDDDKETAKSFLERKIEKGINDMTGIEMACLILSFAWLDYKEPTFNFGN
jgi:hypothetical protein